MRRGSLIAAEPSTLSRRPSLHQFVRKASLAQFQQSTERTSERTPSLDDVMTGRRSSFQSLVRKASHSSLEPGSDATSVRKSSLTALTQRMSDEVHQAADSLLHLLIDAQCEGGNSRLKQIFDKYDSDSNGSLDIDEWNEAMKDLGVSANDDVNEALFRRYDVDGGGSIDYAEFVKYAAKADQESMDREVDKIVMNLKRVLAQKKGLTALKALFDKYDADNSGSLDVEEFAKTLTDLGVGEDASMRELKAAFDRFDVDGSGSLEFMEFVSAVGSAPTETRLRDLERLSLAKEKHRVIEQHKAQRLKDEESFRERTSRATAALEEARSHAENIQLSPARRMEWLKKAQSAAEELDIVKTDELEKAKVWAEFTTVLDDDDRRLLRGVLAMEKMKKMVGGTQQFKKAVARAEQPKAPTIAEVKAKQRKGEAELKQIQDEEDAAKLSKKMALAQHEALQKQLQQLPDTAMMEKLKVLQQLTAAAQELHDATTVLETETDRWRQRREACKLTPEEDRILRGVKAMQKQKTQSKGPTALDILKRRASRSGPSINKSVMDDETYLQHILDEAEQSLAKADAACAAAVGLPARMAAAAGKSAALDDVRQARDALNLYQSTPASARVPVVRRDSEMEAMSKGVAAFMAARRKSVGFALTEEPKKAVVPTMTVEEVLKLESDLKDAAARFYDIVCDFRKEGGHAGMMSLFGKYDADKGGSLDLQEWSEALQDMGVSDDPNVLEALFQRYDIDKSGTIEYDEFIADVNQLTEDARAKEVERINSNLREVLKQKRGLLGLKKLFEQYDADGSGTLDIEEFAATLKDLGVGSGSSTLADFKAVFDQFDVDGSGSIELMEFMDGIKNLNVEERKRESTLIAKAKEKQRAIDRQRETREQAEKEIEALKAEKQAELNSIAARQEKTSLVERLALMQETLIAQTEMQQILMRERELQEDWRIAPKIELTEEEARALRGIKALQAMKKKVETGADNKPKLLPRRVVTAAMVRAKIAQTKRLQAEQAEKEAPVRAAISALQASQDRCEAEMAKMPPGPERDAVLYEKISCAQSIQSKEAELAEICASYKNQLNAYELDAEDQRVLRGLQAASALSSTTSRRKSVSGPQLLRITAKGLQESAIQEDIAKATERLKLLRARLAEINVQNNSENIETKDLTEQIEKEMAAVANAEALLQTLQSKDAVSEGDAMLIKSVASFRGAAALRRASLAPTDNTSNGGMKVVTMTALAAKRFKASVKVAGFDVEAAIPAAAADTLQEACEPSTTTSAQQNRRSAVRVPVPPYRNVRSVVSTQHHRPRLNVFAYTHSKLADRLGGSVGIPIPTVRKKLSTSSAVSATPTEPSPPPTLRLPNKFHVSSELFLSTFGFESKPTTM